MPPKQAVAITGIGAVAPLGEGFAEISAALVRGISGIRPVTHFDASQHVCRVAGTITVPACPAELDRSTYESLLPLEQSSLWCCQQALVDAELWALRQKLRVGLVLGLGAPWMQLWDQDARRGGQLVLDTGPRHGGTVELVRKSLALSGPGTSVAAACASGNHAFALAKDWLEMGWVDVCLAGAIDVSVTPYTLGAFGNLRTLSRQNDTPAAALRPFDRQRDGMVLGEGGAVFVLEPAHAAQARGRKPLAEVAGIGLSSDAHHLVIPSPDPTHAASAVRQALADAQVQPEDVDYVNAHATGTQVGDVCEARVLNQVFGAHARRIPVSATKSMTGHLLGAAAAVEALACVTAIQGGMIPPTINLDEPDPQCDLCHVANQPREQRVKVALSNSFGFGGHNTALVLKAA